MRWQGNGSNKFRWLFLPFLSVIIEVNGNPMPSIRKFLTAINSVIGALQSNYPPAPAQEIFMSTVVKEKGLITPELISFHGYPVEEHEVQTEDGYILTIFRIPHGKNGASKKREPILIQHGLLTSSSDWILLTVEDCLPYLLADNGHDVWLGNFRGNNYSTKHVNLSYKDYRFFDFSMDEHGKYDVPAMIFYILNVTKSSKISYIGHSMGGSSLFIATEKYPIFNKKVRKVVAYAPACYIKHLKSPIFKLFQLLPIRLVEQIMNKYFGGQAVPAPLDFILKTFGPTFCIGGVPRELCNSFIYLIAGFDYEETTNRTASLVVGHSPSETSMKTLVHFLQMHSSGKFCAYDYGVEENLKRYNSCVPHTYNLSAVKIPTYVFYGRNDFLVDPEDAKQTVSELGNIVGSEEVHYPFWSHLDFLFGKDARRWVYEPTVKFLSE